MTINKNFKGYSVAIGLLLILFVHMGSGGTTSVFMPSIVGENGWELSQFSVVFTWAGISGALIALFLTPTVIKKLSARWSLMLASALLGIHYVWYGSATTLLSAYLCAAFGGFGVAFGTTAAASVIIANWFVKNRAAVLGVIFAAASFGTATFQFIGGYMLEMFGYRTSWKLLGGFIVVFCGIVNLLLVKNDPQTIGQQPLLEDDADKETEKKDCPVGVEKAGYTLKEAIRMPVFYMAWVAVAFGVIAYMGFKIYLAILLRSDIYGMDTVTASSYSALFNVFASIAMILGGTISNKLGNKIYISYMCIALAVGLLVFIISGSMAVKGAALIIFAMALCALAAPNLQTTAPIMTSELFGDKGYADICSYLVAAVQVGSAVFPLMCSAILAGGGTVLSCFWLFFISDLVAFALYMLVLAFSPMKKLKKAK